MHIEPGVVEGTKMVLSYGTSAGLFSITAKLAYDTVKKDGFIPLITRSAITTLLVIAFFTLLPHFPVGVSEVHFILGSTLFLLFGAAPAAIGLSLGLLLQGLVLTPFDLPQYGMNVTSLLAPLLAVSVIAQRLIPANTAYKDVSYVQALVLSTAYQGGVVAWVAFWVLYGSGFGVETFVQLGTFAAAYLSVILIEPILDVVILAGAKTLDKMKHRKMFDKRLYQASV